MFTCEQCHTLFIGVARNFDVGGALNIKVLQYLLEKKYNIKYRLIGGPQTGRGPPPWLRQ